MTLNVAIVEDTPAEAQALEQFLTAYGERYNHTFHISIFPSAEQFFSAATTFFELIFMDICLPNADGMTAAARLRTTNQASVLVFVTNMAHMAIQGYEVNAFDFIVKPVNYANFALKLPRILKRVAVNQDFELAINTSNGLIRLQSTHLLYVEIDKHDITYHTIEGNYTSYGNLKQIEQVLSPVNFVRCNNCYLVNLHYVTGVDGMAVTVGSDVLQMSRPRKKPFMNALNSYLGGNVL